MSYIGGSVTHNCQRISILQNDFPAHYCESRENPDIQMFIFASKKLQDYQFLFLIVILLFP